MFTALSCAAQPLLFAVGVATLLAFFENPGDSVSIIGMYKDKTYTTITD